MHKICHYVDFNMQNMQNTCAKYADICIKNTKCVQKYAQNMQQICCYTQKYAQNLHNLHINMQNMLNIRKKFAEICKKYMQKTRIKYAGYA